MAGLIVGGCLLAAIYRWNRELEEDVRLAVQFSVNAGVFGALLVLAVVADPAGWAGRFWNARTLRFFGKYSYGLYVFHEPLRPLYERCFPVEVLSARLGSTFLGSLAYIVAATAASVAVAVLSWHLYEKHFLKLKRFFPARAAT